MNPANPCTNSECPKAQQCQRFLDFEKNPGKGVAQRFMPKKYGRCPVYIPVKADQ